MKKKDGEEIDLISTIRVRKSTIEALKTVKGDLRSYEAWILRQIEAERAAKDYEEKEAKEKR